jgi:segregation and condensation protein A
VTAPYRVALDAFHGPLDLLLYLVRTNEVDVRDVSVAGLADQFVAYLDTLRDLDVDLVGDFLVTAATLMEMKSRTLIPADGPDAADDPKDPRHDLVRQLLEYRAFKDAAAALETRAEAFSTRLSRVPVPPPTADGPPPVRPVELWDLVAAFARLLRETQSLAPTTIHVDETPQHVYAERILATLRGASAVPFRDLFTPPYTKARLIGLFLAVLELIKENAVRLEQPDAFGEIWLSLAPPDENRDASDGGATTCSDGP